RPLRSPSRRAASARQMRAVGVVRGEWSARACPALEGGASSAPATATGQGQRHRARGDERGKKSDLHDLTRTACRAGAVREGDRDGHAAEHSEKGRTEMTDAVKYAVVIEQAGQNFSAYVPDLPGC